MRASQRPPTDWGEVPLVFGIEDFHRIFGGSYEAIKKRCQRGALPAFKEGKFWKFEKNTLMDWINRQMAAGQAGGK